MSRNLPPQLTHSCFLANVAEATYKAAGQAAKLPLEFNVAAWLGFPIRPTDAVGIVLHYADSRGRHAMVIDECVAVEGFSLMLSGKVAVTAVGTIETMSIHCSGIADKQYVRVDELFVQRVQQSTAALRRTRFSATG